MSDKNKEAHKTKSKRLLDDYDKMINLAKTNFDKLNYKKLDKQIKNYSHLLIPDMPDSQFLDFTKSYSRYSNMLNTQNGEKKTKTFFKAIQADLKRKLFSLQNFIETGFSGELLTYTGEIKLIYDKADNRITQVYAPDEIEYDDKIDLNKEFKLFGYKFFEVVSYLIQELPLERLISCPNTKCGLPFFQANQRKKYCSVQCSKAVAHVEYMIREKKKGGGNKKNSKTT